MKQCRNCKQKNIKDKRFVYCSHDCRDAYMMAQVKSREELKKRAERMENFDHRQGTLFGIYPEGDEREQLSWTFDGDPKRERLPVIVDPTQTLRAAQEALLQGVEKGTGCACCGRHAQVYKRTINRNMARGLIWMVREYVGNGTRSPGHWIDMPTQAPKWMLRSNQFATLRWWQLVERKPNEQEVESENGTTQTVKVNSKSKHLGVWKPTERGIMFVRQEITVPKGVYTLFGEPIEFTDEHTKIIDCLEEGFDYEAVMQSVSLDPVAFGE